MCKVVNLYKESYDVYIGRARRGEPANVWENPYPMSNPKDDNERGRVIIKYKNHLWDQIKQGVVTKEMLLELDGKILGCFCSPKLCHGDIISSAVDWAKGEVDECN